MKVLNIVDHLHHGGVQRMALNISNSLPEHGIESHLCTVLDSGQLKSLVSDHVSYFPINASNLYSFKAARKLWDYCKLKKFDIVHVHHRSLFVVFLSNIKKLGMTVIWHDHYGRQNYRERPWLLYYLLTRKVDGTISVSHCLRNWAIKSMRFPDNKVKFIPNFVEMDILKSTEYMKILPGEKGYRIVCVANFRPQKDHLTLIRAFHKVVEVLPGAHLILVGDIEDNNYYDLVTREINRLSLSQQISNLGKQLNIASILKSSDLGVLSSRSEGLPLTLLEYGMVGLPVACTSVGDCGWVVKDKISGLLSKPGEPNELASNMVFLLQNKEISITYGKNLKSFVSENLSKSHIIQKTIKYYNELRNTKN